MDVVSRDVPGLIGMYILDSKDHSISIFKWDIVFGNHEFQWT